MFKASAYRPIHMVYRELIHSLCQSKCDNWIHLHLILCKWMLAIDPIVPINFRFDQFLNHSERPMHLNHCQWCPVYQVYTVYLHSNRRYHPYWLVYKLKRSSIRRKIQQSIAHFVHVHQLFYNRNTNWPKGLVFRFSIQHSIRQILLYLPAHGNKRCEPYRVCVCVYVKCEKEKVKKKQ